MHPASELRIQCLVLDSPDPARLESLGARRVDLGQGPDGWVVMGDPDGNEFCVLTPLPTAEPAG